MTDPQTRLQQAVAQLTPAQMRAMAEKTGVSYSLLEKLHFGTYESEIGNRRLLAMEQYLKRRA